MKRRDFLLSSIAAGVSIPASEVIAALNALTTIPAEIAAVTGDGDSIALHRSTVTELAESLRGALLLPGNDGYDEARRVLNAGIDKHPALVVQPSGATDVRHAVDFAREHRLLLAVKCGGHSYSGKSTCDGGLQLDLSTLRHARVDPGARKAWIAGGCLLAELDRESMALGLVTTAGTVSHTGVGGLTLGGGFGRVARRFGLALDNVSAVDIVTADGALLRASAAENPDLFWGVRGGGGNFGVVTNFEFELHPMQRQVIAGELFYPIDRARDVLNVYSEFAALAPDELYCDCLLMGPSEGAGSPMAGFSLCYTGPAAGAEAALAPLAKLGKPIVDGVGPADYVRVQQSWDDSDPRNSGEYIKSGFVNEIPQDLVDEIVAGFEWDPGRNTMLYFQHSGGAIGRVPADATAFAHRASLANMMVMISWPLASDGSPHVAYLRRYWKTLERFTDGWYTNEISNEPQPVINSNYQVNFERLLAVKNRYDPENLFRLNANIRPTANRARAGA